MHMKSLLGAFLFSILFFGISTTFSFATNNCGVGHASIGNDVSFSNTSPGVNQSVTVSVTANNTQRVDVAIVGPGGAIAAAQNGGFCAGTTCSYTFPTNQGAGTYTAKFNAWDTCSGEVSNHYATGTVNAIAAGPPPPPPVDTSVKGYIDVTNMSLFSGWTCQAQHGGEANTVHFYMDGEAGKGQFLGATTANVQREQAVGSQCEGNINHGFAVDPHSLTNGNVLFDGKSHQIYAYGLGVGGNGPNPLLGGSPITMTGPTTGSVTFHFEGIDSLNNTKPHHLQRSLVLYFYTANTYGSDPMGVKADYTARDTLTFSSGSSNSNDSLAYVFTNTTFNLGSVATNDYYILAKSPEGSLRQLLSNQKIHITAGTNTILVNTDNTNGSPTIPLLLMGDINNNNQVGVDDYAILRDCYGANAVQSRCSDHHLADTTVGLFADLNDDGVIDGIDYNLLIRNMNANGL